MLHPKLHPKYNPLMFVAVMALLMSGAMSFAMTIIHSGFVEGFFIQWRNAFAAGYMVAFPLSFVIAPAARSIVALLVREALASEG